MQSCCDFYKWGLKNAVILLINFSASISPVHSVNFFFNHLAIFTNY